MSEETRAKKEIVIKRRTTPVKKRSATVYNRKVNKITKWYEILEKNREIPVRTNPNNKRPVGRKELKPLEEYITKIKKIEN
jgi:hypothetical protein